MHYVTAKGILSPSGGMNLYRGCSHGCIYCDSRSACYNMPHGFEDIEVKENAIELLEKALSAKRKNNIMCDNNDIFSYLRTFEEKETNQISLW